MEKYHLKASRKQARRQSTQSDGNSALNSLSIWTLLEVIGWRGEGAETVIIGLMGLYHDL